MSIQDDMREAATLLREPWQCKCGIAEECSECSKRFALSARLTAHAAAMDAASPVAWMVRDDGWNQAFSTREQANTYGKELQPLYTHPDPPDVVEALQRNVKACRKALRAIAKRSPKEMPLPPKRISYGDGYEVSAREAANIAREALANLTGATNV